ncbi:calcium-binding protein [Pararhodobacter zhoushanensis]|uniref:calcium-binding protein n=1 Tax=Pararhodobacter zhoushanensis TaxID=2479545 RepID=UPI0013E09544|nr:hypothetical protein [Pararhodobacter zhoushanensis]
MVIAFAFLALVLAVSLNGGDSDSVETDEDITGTDGDDALQTGDGNDLVQGLDGNDSIIGGAGDDTLMGDGGDDWLDGGAGINEVHGGDGNDTLVLNDGFDALTLYDANGNISGFEQSLLDGGEGDGDLFDASGMSENLHLYIGQTNAYAGTSPLSDRAVTLDGFERYALGSGMDVVEMDLWERGVAVDTGAGRDLVSLTNAAHQVNLGDGDDDLSIWASDALDEGMFIDGGDGRDLLEVNSDEGHALAALVVDATGSGVLTDTQGGTLHFANMERFDVMGARADASATGFGVEITGATTVLGGTGDDTLAGGDVFGGDGDDVLRGTVLDGGAGDDTLFASQITDRMTGGEGTDSFTINRTMRDGYAPNDPLVITDFEPGESVTMVLHYNEQDTEDYTVSHPEPVITIEQDSVAHEVRILADGQPVVILQGTDSLPEGAFTVSVLANDIRPE